MPKHILTAEDGRKGGKKSRRKPFDQKWRDKLEEVITTGTDKGKTRHDVLFEIIENEAKNGNMVAFKELYDRCYGKSKQSIETRDKTLEDNPLYEQLKYMRDKK